MDRVDMEIVGRIRSYNMMDNISEGAEELID